MAVERRRIRKTEHGLSGVPLVVAEPGLDSLIHPDEVDSTEGDIEMPHDAMESHRLDEQRPFEAQLAEDHEREIRERAHAEGRAEGQAQARAEGRAAALREMEQEAVVATMVVPGTVENVFVDDPPPPSRKFCWCRRKPFWLILVLLIVAAVASGVGGFLALGGDSSSAQGNSPSAQRDTDQGASPAGPPSIRPSMDDNTTTQNCTSNPMEGTPTSPTGVDAMPSPRPSLPPTRRPSFRPTTIPTRAPISRPMLPHQCISAAWSQLGQDIDGEAANDNFGGAIATSADGSRIAAGSADNNGNGSFSGHVRVFEYSALTQQWAQIGQDIDGKAPGDQSGRAVVLSGDGSRVAVGAPANDGNGNLSGLVRVYEYEGSSQRWIQIGQDIEGEDRADQSGDMRARSLDGSRFVVDAVGNDGNGAQSGHVRVYEYSGSVQLWLQLGQDVDGEAAGDESGRSVAISADGVRMAVGATLNDGNGESAGHVRIYEYSLSSRQWLQVGRDLDGEAAGDESGRAVALSADGSRVVIGAFLNDGNGSNSGQARVFEWSTLIQDWVQFGQDVDGEAADDQAGISVMISADGLRVAVGAYRNDGSGSNAGHVRVFDFSLRDWVQLGLDIDGEGSGDFSGYAAAMSSDGSRVAIGAYRNDGVNGSFSGHVRMYELNC